MSLSREARGLVDAARREAAGGPSPEQRKRMRRAVMGAVGAGAIAGATATSGTAAAAIATGSGLGLISKVSIGLAVVGLIGGGAALVSQHREAPTALASVPVSQPLSTSVSLPLAASVAATPSAPITASSEPATAQSASASAVAQAPSQRTLPETNGGLAEELRLLKEAQSASGSAAVAILDQYAARFPKGQLAYEARALRAMALCKSGRMDEGRALATAISESSPGTPLAERVTAACK